ncbi:thiamine pyrophosphate-binding protein [Paenibacillus albiflavus]|uniref:Thiamine pyrophosphate-binding protein n=1 Tax=Paenibacillus albiflavus TaxID=2545760 RepID=A0A4R4EB47_9BACL|nr:thiamine pyrophosphate-binding protein [Paenibacillus albiflavus]TCZ77084.1 thiamine pyrophosphate-binding protein [Paenibacillus albiflavus]
MVHVQTLSVANVILEQLQLTGVKRIYGIVGDSLFGFMDALAKQDSIQFIAVKHESTAAFMAAAEARLTGSLSVCIATSGPGLANLINGLSEARMDNLPVLALTGQVPLRKIGTHYKQYIDQQQLINPIATYSSQVVHPDSIIDVLTNAIYTSIAEKTVTHVSIPEDLFEMEIMFTPRPIVNFARLEPQMGKIHEAVKVLRDAKRPMIMVGKQAKACEASIVHLSEVWGAGIVNEYAAIGVIPEENPVMLGGLGEGGNNFANKLFQQADVVLQIGTTWWPNKDVPDQAHVILIHPTNHHLNMSVPVEIGLFGDVNKITVLLNEVFRSGNYQRNENWLQQIHENKQLWKSLNDKERNQTAFPFFPSNIVKAIESGISEDAIIALDIGDSNLWFQRNFKAKRQQQLVSDYWRSMGYGLPAAMAAKIVMPNRQVLCIAGDGGLEMGLAELLTAVRYQLIITLILFNNQAYQMEADKMKMKGFVPYGTDLTNPDFMQIAEACGWTAIRINHIDQLEKIMKEAINFTTPVFIDVPTRRVPYPDYG